MSQRRDLDVFGSFRGLGAVAALAWATSVGWAQPVPVTDLGTLSLTQSVVVPLQMGPNPTPRVKWFRFCVGGTTCLPRWMDIETTPAVEGETTNTIVGLYSSTGTLLGVDDNDGPGNYSALSFGSATPARPATTSIVGPGPSTGLPFDGRDGGAPAGCYYLAVTLAPATFLGNFEVNSLTGPPQGRATLRVQIGLNPPANTTSPGWDVLPGTPGLSGEAYASCVYDSGLVVAGVFTQAGGAGAHRIAKWNGSAWVPLGNNITFNNTINALAVYQEPLSSTPSLFAAGQFTQFQVGTNTPVVVNHIARWDGTAWTAVGTTGINGYVPALHVSSIGGTPSLYAGGTFSMAGTTACSNLARWDGTNWSAVGGGTNFGVFSFADYNDGTPGLFVGGIFTSTGSGPASRIAKWSGSAWSQPGAGLNGNVWALTTHFDGVNTRLYAGGAFTASGATALDRVARWDGSAWTPVNSPTGQGVNGQVYGLASYDSGDGTGPGLFAGGDFTMAANLAANRLARWQCNAWSALDGGADARVYNLRPVNISPALRGLFTVGNFTHIDGLTANRVARWGGADCNGNGVLDGVDISCGLELDCNLNCIPDSCDIASGFSTDCNKNGVPDECEVCPPMQVHLAEGGQCNGPMATAAWTRRVSLIRSWFERDGDPIFGKGDVVLSWKNRAVDSPDDSGRTCGSVLESRTNISSQEMKITRTPKKSQNCTGKHSFNWNDEKAPAVFYDDGPDAADIIGNAAGAQVRLDMDFREYDYNFLKGLAAFGLVVLSPAALVVDCLLWTLPNWITNVDNYCQGGFIEDYVDLIFAWLDQERSDNWSKTIGRIECVSSADPLSTSPNCGGTSSCAPAATNYIEYTPTSTRAGKPAKVQMRWDITGTGAAHYQGQKLLDPRDCTLSPYAADEIRRYEFFQRSGTEFVARVVMDTGADMLAMPTNWPERVVRFYFDIDTNVGTGATGTTECGAEYQVRVRLVPSNGKTRSYADIFAWCNGMWMSTGKHPMSWEVICDRGQAVLSGASIGICKPGRRVASWVVVDKGSGPALDTCPSDVCGTRACIQVANDIECPIVDSVSAVLGSGAGVTGILVNFSEPMKQFAPGDVQVWLYGAANVPVTLAAGAINKSVFVTPAVGTYFPGGQLEVRIRDTLTDLAGNALDGDRNGVCGGNAVETVCAEETRMSPTDGSGTPQYSFAPAETLFCEASGFAALAGMNLYAVDSGDIVHNLDLLIDQTDDGPSLAFADSAGVLSASSLGLALHQQELMLVADVNFNGVFDAGIDMIAGACSAALVVGTPCEEAVEDVVAYWMMDEAAGAPAAQEVMFRNHGLYFGGPTPIAGINQGALAFGPGAHAEAADDAALDMGIAPYSIEFWIAKSAAGFANILDKRSGVIGYNVAIDATNRVVVSTGGTPPLNSRTLMGGNVSPESWHHVVISCERTFGVTHAMTIYVDSVAVANDPTPALEDMNNAGKLLICGPLSGGARPVLSLDELRFYDRALSASDVRSIFLRGGRGICDDLPPCPICPADYNQDGGIDGSDLAAFYASWEAAEACADINGDGGIDGADRELFEKQWEAGLCCTRLKCDLTGDGVTNCRDAAFFWKHYRRGSPFANLNGDGAVNSIDVLDFMLLYGSDCGPDCRGDADFDGDGDVDCDDWDEFHLAHAAATPDADYDKNGVVNAADRTAFETAFLGVHGPC